jgi:hypothetical protein
VAETKKYENIYTKAKWSGWPSPSLINMSNCTPVSSTLRIIMTGVQLDMLVKLGDGWPDYFAPLHSQTLDLALKPGPVL